MAKVADIINLMEYIAPSWMACKGDVNGLQAGSTEDKVSKILLALDATAKTVEYAAKNKYQMILTHHPRFYAPLKNICKDTFLGSIAYKLCRNNIALYNAHTNFDIAPGGVNDVLADIAGINERSPVEPVVKDDILKLTVYVDDKHVDGLKEALVLAGAGEIGNYSDCCFRTVGIGCFRPGSGAKPYSGRIGELYESEEWRLEMVLPQSLKAGVLRALRENHPYEEPAYDLVQIQASNRYGLGRVGDLNREVALSSLARKYKKATGSNGVLVLKSNDKPVSRLAVWSGSGVDIGSVVQSGADCLVCGELGYHVAEELEFYNVSAVVLGHCPCEEIALSELRENILAGVNGVNVDIAPRFSPDFVSI